MKSGVFCGCKQAVKCYNLLMSKYISSTPDILSGTPVIKGTRIPIDAILYRLKEGYPLEAIHDMYSWVNIKTLEGAIDEAIQAVSTTFQMHEAS
jgi:uncharacterized protein (DUF433 family)